MTQITMMVWSLIPDWLAAVYGVAKSPTRLSDWTELLGYTISVLYCFHLCMKYSLGISSFLEKISCLSNSIIFLYFLALISEESFLSLLAILWTLHSNGYIFPFLLCLLLLFSQLFISPSETTILPSWGSFSFGSFWSLPPVQCYKPLPTVLQAL